MQASAQAIDPPQGYLVIESLGREQALQMLRQLPTGPFRLRRGRSMTIAPDTDLQPNDIGDGAGRRIHATGSHSGQRAAWREPAPSSDPYSISQLLIHANMQPIGLWFFLFDPIMPHRWARSSIFHREREDSAIPQSAENQDA